MTRIILTKAQAAQLEAAKPAGKAAFLVGYAERHRWPDNGKFTAVVTFCSYEKATKAAQAIGLIDKPAKKSRPAKKRARKPTAKKGRLGQRARIIYPDKQ